MFPLFQERLSSCVFFSLYSQFIYELNGALNWPFYYDMSQWNFLFDVVMISIWLLIVDQRSIWLLIVVMIWIL